jgi:Mg-chelatase subunit ChlD
VLPPTNSVLLAQEALADVPVGGKTPLSAGLMMSYEVIRKEKLLHPEIMPLLIILTDGAGNVSIGRHPPQEEAFKFAEMIAQEKFHSVVINMEHAAFDQGLAQALADHLNSPCYTITDLKAESLFVTVQQEIRQVNANPAIDFK